MANQTQVELFIGTEEKRASFTPKQFPRNLDIVELEHAVNKYRQAIRQLVEFSKRVEVYRGR